MATQDQILASYAVTHSEEQTALALGIGRWQVRTALGRNPRHRHITNLTQQQEGGMLSFDEIAIPGAEGPAPEPVLVVPDANALIICDTHKPYHNRDMLRKSIYVTKRYFPHIDTLIHLGDLFNFESLSAYPRDGQAPTAEEELEVAGEALYSLLGYFKRAYFCSGNHDERVAKRLNSQWTLKRTIYAALEGRQIACEIHVTNMDYMRVESADGDGRKDWLVGHPSGYSAIPGKTAGDLAQHHQRNIITAHEHSVGEQQSRDGRWVGIAAGHMTEPGRHYYKRRRLSKYTEWTAGFVILSNGYAYRYTERGTDWSALGC